jgi:hypothetical protein
MKKNNHTRDIIMTEEDYKKENDGKESKRCKGCSETT